MAWTMELWALLAHLNCSRPTLTYFTIGLGAGVLLGMVDVCGYYV